MFVNILLNNLCISRNPKSPVPSKQKNTAMYYHINLKCTNLQNLSRVVYIDKMNSNYKTVY